jgi:hypothetical protein
MTRVISVMPADRGWMVSSEAFDNPMVFLSGAKAEQAARRLGAKLAGDGQRAEVHIFLRDGSLAGQVVCAPSFREIAPAA